MTGTGATTVGNSSAALVLRPPLTGNSAWNAGYGSSSYGQIRTLDQLSLALTGYRQFEPPRAFACWTYAFR